MEVLVGLNHIQKFKIHLEERNFN